MEILYRATDTSISDISKTSITMGAKIIAISNNKGGVGKTTSCINIGACLANMGYKTLLVDLDAQGNLTQSLHVPTDGGTMYEAMLGREDIKPVEVYNNLYVAPSSMDLSAADIELSGVFSREYVLKDKLQPLLSKYDYIIIDTAPTLGLLTINAFVAADNVVIPLQAEFLALQGLQKLTEIISKIQQRLNPSLKIAGVVLTQYDKRKVLNKSVEASIGSYFSNVFKSVIRENIALAEAPATGLDIFRYNNKSYGAIDYINLTKEILQVI